MDESLLPKLKKCARTIVDQASQKGGTLDKGEFTMSLARKLITEEMGLKEGSLDGKEWKKVVKEEVTTALAEPEPPKSKPKSNPNPKPKSEPKVETKPKPEPKSSKPESKPKIKPESDKKDKESDEKTKEPSSEPKIDAGHESDMSSVYDAPPKRKSKSSESTSKEKRPKKDADEGLSPDETKIAELKRIVVACGVRKQWSKEFADCPSVSSQIRHLQSILTDLGMKGTPTIGKAKSLKEKRELAAELDDVQEFEAKRGVSDAPEERASRSKDTGRRPSAATSIGLGDEDEEEVQVGAKQNSALASVLDFLGDQSDSD